MKKKNIEDLSRKEWENLIDQYVFNEAHRPILKRRLLDGITFERLSEEFDMSTRQIKNIVYKSQEKLFKHI